LFLEIALGPWAGFDDIAARFVMLGTNEAVLVRIVERGVRFLVGSVVDAFDNEQPRFCHGHPTMIVEVNRRFHQLLGNECPGEVVGEMAIYRQSQHRLPFLAARRMISGGAEDGRCFPKGSRPSCLVYAEKRV